MDRRTWLRARVGRFHPLWAGRLCLDFANTVEPRGGPSPGAAPPASGQRDELGDYADLVAWAVHASALAGEAEALLAEAERDPVAAEAAFAVAIGLREGIYRVFWAVAHGDQPPAADLDALVRVHAEGIAHARLERVGPRFRLAWEGAPLRLDRPLWSIATSAVVLLTEDELARVKVCPGEGNGVLACAWLFYDATKSRNRQWCSMADCGNATKSRRRAERRQAARARERWAAGRGWDPPRRPGP